MGDMKGEERWMSLLTMGEEQGMQESMKIRKGFIFEWNRISNRREEAMTIIKARDNGWSEDTKDIMGQDMVSFGYGKGAKIGKIINDSIQHTHIKMMDMMAMAMPSNDMRYLSYTAAKKDKIAQALIANFGWPLQTNITDSEVSEIFANYLGLKSPIAELYEGKIIKSNQGKRVDGYGAQLKAATGDAVKYWESLGFTVSSGQDSSGRDLINTNIRETILSKCSPLAPNVKLILKLNDVYTNDLEAVKHELVRNYM